MRMLIIGEHMSIGEMVKSIAPKEQEKKPIPKRRRKNVKPIPGSKTVLGIAIEKSIEERNNNRTAEDVKQTNGRINEV